MVAFVIFWSATFAIIFFLLCILFKSLVSALEALLSSLDVMVIIGGGIGAVGVALYLLYLIIDELNKNGIILAILNVILLITAVAILVGLGANLMKIIVIVIREILSIVAAVSERAANLCEQQYKKFLKAIISRLDKC